MIYLSSSGTTKQVQALRESGVQLGLMLTPRSYVRVALAQQYGVWAADNGCYSQGESFNLQDYLKWLRAMSPAKSNCLFATAPDVVGNALATRERSRDVLPIIKEMGYKAALVAQDGLQDMAVEWDAFDVFFVGGTTWWKLTHGLVLAWEAKQRGKWVHVGRVNSLQRIRLAAQSGADSTDGTHIAFEPDIKIAQTVEWLRAMDEAPPPIAIQKVLAGFR